MGSANGCVATMKFSLKTLFLVYIVVAAFFGGFAIGAAGEYDELVKTIKQRDFFIDQLEQKGGLYGWPQGMATKRIPLNSSLERRTP